MKPLERMIHIDYLRTFIIMLVVAFHVSLTFMAKAPQWWYVKSDHTSLLFTLIVIILDVFMMPVLFFISGYVMPLGQTNYKSSHLIKNRVIKLGFPWIICTLFIAPFLSLSMAQALGHDVSYTQMISNLFWTKEYYYQGPYWFLGILLTLQIAIIVVNRSVGFTLFVKNIPTSAIWAVLLLIPFAGYSTGSFFFGVESWVSLLYLWSFQPSRILTYICYFLAGYTLGVKKTSFTINISVSAAGSVILATIFVILKGKFENSNVLSIYLLQGFCYSCLALLATTLLLAVFNRLFKKTNGLFSFLSRCSFNTYLIHLPLQVIVASLIIKTIPGLYLPWIVLYSLILLLSIVVSFILRIGVFIWKHQDRLRSFST